ncbi:hypothetical protein ACQU0X_25585 [Pseudovibrio ascidiaceicola]|uniref:DUF5983 family protein n=1 Tax=Pseudovibrio ascidiaceicola TaxID=285279 RepID=UPI003D36CCD6
MSAEHVTQLFNLSLRHLSAETFENLSLFPIGCWPLFGGRTTYGFFFGNGEGGDPDLRREKLPSDLYQVVEYARAAGCTHILVDRDVPEIDELPIYPENERGNIANLGYWKDAGSSEQAE